MDRTTGIAVNDTILWVDDTAETHLAPVLCLHSLWFDRTMFKDFTEAARGKYRIICPDFRGQGLSAPATEKMVSMEDCAEDMEALIEAMDLGAVHIVAQSMGGDVAIRLAAKRPDLVQSLTMLGSSARGEPPEQLAWVDTWLQDAAKDHGFKGENLETLMAVMFGETTRNTASMADVLTHWRDKMESWNLSLWPAIHGVIQRKNVAHLLPGIDARTLIVSGTEDMPRPPEWADEVVAGLPNATLLRLEKVGHSPTLEAPDQVIPAILDFLGKVPMAKSA